MNEQIFDWGENSEKILRGEGYTTFHSRFREQVALVRYLLDRNHEEEEIYGIWKNTNPETILYADTEEEKREVYKRVRVAARKWQNRFYSSVMVYKEEMDYINQMDEPLWVKQYVLCMLVVYKYYQQTYCQYTNRIKCFCYSKTNVKFERSQYTLTLCDCIKNYRVYDTVIHDSNVAFKVNFAQSLGTPLARIKSPAYVEELYKWLKDSRVCTCCGKSFECSSKSLRRMLCDECYRKERNRAKNANKKRIRQFTTNQYVSE